MTKPSQDSTTADFARELAEVARQYEQYLQLTTVTDVTSVFAVTNETDPPLASPPLGFMYWPS